jgi:hypothetical protein
MKKYSDRFAVVIAIGLTMLFESNGIAAPNKVRANCWKAHNACYHQCKGRPQSCFVKCDAKVLGCLPNSSAASQNAQTDPTSRPPKGTGNRPPTGGGVVTDPSRPPKGTGGHVPPRGGVISEPKGPPRGVGNSAPFGNSIRSNPGPGSGSSGPILKGSPGGRR